MFEGIEILPSMDAGSRRLRGITGDSKRLCLSGTFAIIC